MKVNRKVKLVVYVALWRNGSATDSRSVGYMFDSCQGHIKLS